MSRAEKCLKRRKARELKESEQRAAEAQEKERIKIANQLISEEHDYAASGRYCSVESEPCSVGSSSLSRTADGSTFLSTAGSVPCVAVEVEVDTESSIVGGSGKTTINSASTLQVVLVLLQRSR